MLSFGKEAKHSRLPSALWYRNTAGHFDERAYANVGYTKRKEMAAESRQIDVMEQLHLDLAFQNKFLLNGVEIRIRLIKSKNTFCLHGNADQAIVKVLLKEVAKSSQTLPSNCAQQSSST